MNSKFNHSKTDIYDAMGINRNEMKEALNKINTISEECIKKHGNRSTSRVIEKLTMVAKEDEAILRILIAESVFANTRKDK